MSFLNHPANAQPSLAMQLKRQLFLLSLALMVIFLVILHWGLNRLTQDVVLARLERQAANLISALVYQTEQQSWQLRTAGIDEIYHRVHSGAYYYIDSEQVQYSSRSLWDIQLTLDKMPLDQQTHYLDTRLQGQTWLVLQQGIQKHNTHFTIWVAEDISELKISIYILEIALVGVFLFVLAIQVSLQQKIILGAFARLTPLQNAITAQRMGETFDLPKNTPQEVTPLVEAIRQLLQTSSAQIKRSRMALGNLAHELKHPLQHLAHISQGLESKEQAQLLQAIYQELHYKIERELKRARIAGTPNPGQYFMPDQEILHIVNFLQMMRETPLDFTYQNLASQGKTQLPFDRDDMLELFGNLLDNAWRYAHQQVRLSWTLEAHQLQAQIEDDGEGVAAASLALLTQRGVRLDEQAGAGHGLGLSICQAIVESYQGELAFQASPLGGLQVNVRLPLP
ncbi:Signal transduction histidine kinase [Allopseudospirillum japonicum]|uniref:histidine kinase n=1 Tax=Allopseudospirillum japonicum TaxID=64971 RepID=A0A1H6RTG1_9GAMM|nr:sensor histidine kinase [Allopseudospirillum japonicum]SEI55080.1 Signal transduction histidine kinase [Allopseudospirillum japonicum]